MPPRKIKAVDKGMPRSKYRFSKSIRENGDVSVIYKLRRLGKPTLVFHYVYDKNLVLKHWEPKTPSQEGVDACSKVVYGRYPGLKPKKSTTIPHPIAE